MAQQVHPAQGSRLGAVQKFSRFEVGHFTALQRRAGYRGLRHVAGQGLGVEQSAAGTGQEGHVGNGNRRGTAQVLWGTLLEPTRQRHGLGAVWT